MRAMRGSGKVVCFGWWLAACGAANAQGGESLTSHDRSDGTLVWQACPKLPPFPDEPRGECSKNRVPLFWDERAAGELEIVVRRFQPKGPRRGTLWMLAGGPGGTGTVFNTPAWRSLSVERGFALMVPTPRGSGLSTPLECPEQEAPDSEQGALVSDAEFGACAAALGERWGSNLAAFASAQTAEDVLHLIDREKQPGERTVVFGGSYGAFLAERLLELAPDALDAVILEGLVPEDVNFLDLSANVDEAMHALLEQCASTPACEAHFESGPVAAAAALLTASAAGTACGMAEGMDALARQRLFASAFLGDTALRPLLAPLLLRFSRCSASDRAELHSALERFPNVGEEPTPARSLSGTLLDPLVWNLRLASLVIHTDLIRAGKSRKEVEALEQSLLASAGLSERFFHEHQEWPEHLTGHGEPRAAKTSVPMLMFAGALDAQTPLSWSKRAAATHTAEHQRLVVVPTAGHMTYTFAKTTTGSNCTIDIWKAFMDDPQAPLSTSCVEQIVPLDWGGASAETRALSRSYFGTDDVWGRE